MVAIANPEHAPYGKAAKQALTKAGVWAGVEPRMVFGENVQQALTFAQSGNVEVAVVALSLAISAHGAYMPIDPELYDPLDQAMIVCKAGEKAPTHENEARAFLAFVSSERGRDVMKRYGFLLPGETVAPK